MITSFSFGWFIRFGYDTDNQFRAERRYPNGTVAGYYGYVRADGKPIRVKYGAVDDLGFTAVQEIIPAKFPEVSTTEPSELEGSGATTVPIVVEEEEKNKNDVIFLAQNEPVIDDDKESVSIDAADYFRDGLLRTDEQPARFVFPKIDVPDLPRRKSRSAQWLGDSPPIPVQRAAQRRIVAEKYGNGPTIIYAEPEPPRRIFKTAATQFTTN